MKSEGIRKLICTIVLLASLAYIVYPFTVNTASIQTNDTSSLSYNDPVYLNTTETTFERTFQKKIQPNSISEIFYSYDYLTSRFIKSHRSIEIIFSTFSESNIRLATFLVTQISTST
jgi:hypothetical protein